MGYLVKQIFQITGMSLVSLVTVLIPARSFLAG